MERLILPVGYEYRDVKHDRLESEGQIITPEGETFDLTDRRWQEVNEALGWLPSIAIDHKLRTQRTTRVLDVGCGVRGVAMQELQEQSVVPRRRKKLQVFGVDLVGAPELTQVRTKVLGSAACLPFASNSIDVAYSCQSVALHADSVDDPRRRKPLQPSLDEVARVLRPGGVFVIDLHWLFDKTYTQPYGTTLTLPPHVDAYWDRREDMWENFGCDQRATVFVKHARNMRQTWRRNQLMRELDLQSYRRITE